jgi:hypothetical protein
MCIRKNLTSLTRKQVTNIQNSSKTRMDLRYRALVLRQQIQYISHTAIPVKLLHIITNAPRYVTNQTLHSDLHSVLQDYIHKHRLALESHPNPLVQPLIHTTHTKRLKRRWTWTDSRINDINNSTLAYRELCTVFSDC